MMDRVDRRPVGPRAAALLGPVLLLAALPAPAPGQAGAAALGATAIPLLTHATPALYGEDRTEGYLTQPMLMGHLAWRALELRGMLNFEGLTLERGELNAGIWGEGYVDRRHPHTYLHELMGTARLARGAGLAASLSLGRGFVPYGTDDPMARPMVKYPVNHHYAQVLERLVAVGAARVRGVGVEASLFHGDEPQGPDDLGNPGRFGDSWSARLTLWPRDGVELQASHARLESPEMRDPQGTDQRKTSVSARYAGPDGLPYALAEWARSTDHDDGLRGRAYHTLLAEAAVPVRGVRLAARLERTDRPEEERLLDPFRTQRPHIGAHLLGVTRWEIATVHLAARAPRLGPFAAEPFAEVARLRAREVVRPSFFEPSDFYGSERMWSLSLGARLAVGSTHARTGRYGAALPPAAPEPDAHAHP